MPLPLDISHDFDTRLASCYHHGQKQAKVWDQYISGSIIVPRLGSWGSGC